MWCRHPCLLLSAARCRRSLLFSKESPCSVNTTSDENGGWIFDLLCLDSRARRTALLSESGETPLLLSAPALLPLSLVPCRFPLLHVFDNERRKIHESLRAWRLKASVHFIHIYACVPCAVQTALLRVPARPRYYQPLEWLSGRKVEDRPEVLFRFRSTAPLWNNR